MMGRGGRRGVEYGGFGTLLWAMLGWLLLPAARARATDPVQAMLTVEPPVAIVGQTIGVVLTVSDTGVNTYANITVTLAMTSGANLVTLVAGQNPSTSNFIGPGGMYPFGWTLSATGQGEVHLLGKASGYINSVLYEVSSSVILLIPGPTAPAIRVLNNHVRPGASAQVILHGRAGGSATLTLYDQSGAPLGPLGTVGLDGGGNGSTRVAGVIAGRRLSPGVYWIVATGDASARAPILVTDH